MDSESDTERSENVSESGLGMVGDRCGIIVCAAKSENDGVRGVNGGECVD